MSNKWVPGVAALLVLGIAASVPAGQLGYWAFDDGSGTTARDSSGNGNNGRLINGPVWVNGILGKALQFDGIDDYVEVPHDAKLEPTTGQATVAVWINARRHTGPNNAQWQGILAKGGAPRLYNLYTQQNQTLHFSTGPSGAYIGSSSTGTVPLNEWVHIAVVVDDAHLYYLNGEPAGVVSNGATVPTGSTAALTIGRTSETDREFLGMIDDVRLYDVALTPQEVKDLYQGNPPSWPKARNPSPADGATGVPAPLLSWEPGDGALFHDVYFGTSPELTEADRVATRQPIAMYWHAPGLESGVTYYWRVDEIEADMVTVHTGDVWSFTAIPVKAYDPNPADGARNVPRDAKLVWSPASGAISHDVYLGASRDEVAAGTGDTFKGNQFETTFNPGMLDGDTTYYWRVDEVKTDNSKAAGDIWSFRTLPATPISDPNLVGWWKLDETAGTFVMDSSGYGNHGTLRSNPLWVTGVVGGALQFDGIDDYVEVPHNPVLAMQGQATVAVWINAARHTGPGGSQWQGILAKGGAPRLYNLYTESSQVLHFSTGPSGAYIGSLSTGRVPLNEWVHVGVVVDGRHLYYLNGEPAGEGGAGATVPGGGTATFTIGRTDQTNFFLGMIDDVRIYDAALTQEQIQEAMRGDPVQAWGPQPSTGAIVDIRQAVSLGWTPGEGAAEHDVYFGSDVTAVSDADTSSAQYLGRQTDPSYPLDGLVEFGGGAYFWRIDEVEADGVTIHKGRVWTFTLADYLIVDDFESYTDDEGSRIYETWIDGYADGSSGSTVGYLEAPFTEQTIVHGGEQSMPLEYNNIDSPWFSEAERTWATAEDWTAYGVADLTLYFRGHLAPPVVVENAGAISLTAEGADIWNDADQFGFVYRTLNGNGSLSARVVSNGTGSNTWAKGGVMIRDSLAAGSTHAMMVITGGGGNGASFQWRPVADAASSNSDAATAVAPPYWVKIERSGDTLTASLSADGVTWTQQGQSQFIPMAAPVYIGLCVTSHAPGELRTFEFDNIKTTGGVAGQWQAVDVGLTRNSTAPLYVAIQDTANKVAVVTHPDPAAVNVTDWTEWKIPLGAFTGVNPARVKRMYIGVGDRENPTPDGSGLLFIDDIRVTGPAPAE